MKKVKLVSLAAFVVSLLFFTACEGLFDSGVTSYNEDVSSALAAADNQILLKQEFAEFDAGPFEFADADAVFSINWKPFIDPETGTEALHSHVFGVAPDPVEDPELNFRSSKDMGDVTLTYSGGEVALKQIEKRAGGIFYVYGKKGKVKLGGSQGHGKRGREGKPDGSIVDEDFVEIPFIADGTYSFYASGSDAVSEISVEIKAPSELLKVTAPAADGTFEADKDIEVTWTGGGEGQIVIALMPVFKPEFGDKPDGKGPREGMGPHDGGKGFQRGDGDKVRSEDSFGGPGLKHEMFEEFALRYIVEDNSGTFQIPTADVQELLTKIEATNFRLVVTQMISNEINEGEAKYVTQIRTGDMIKIQVAE